MEFPIASISPLCRKSRLGGTGENLAELDLLPLSHVFMRHRALHTLDRKLLDNLQGLATTGKAENGSLQALSCPRYEASSEMTKH